MLGGFGLVIPTQSARSSQQTRALNREIERVAGLVSKTRTDHPNLPGFNNVETWASDTFSKRFSQRDAEILQGALYLKALETFEKNRPRKTSPTSATVREVFSNPEPMRRVTKDYLANLLRATQRRMRNEPRFAREVNAASRNITTTFSGSELKLPCPWWCVVIVIVIIVVVIILTV